MAIRYRVAGKTKLHHDTKLSLLCAKPLSTNVITVISFQAYLPLLTFSAFIRQCLLTHITTGPQPFYTGCPRRNVPDFGRVLNGYGDNGQRKVWSPGGSTHCTCQLTSLIDVYPWVWCPITESLLTLAYSRLKPECDLSHVTSVLAFMCHV